ncbi:ubiquitin carboxyl-terminal hydrolase 27 [Olea europaea subsp. europaea]|uniref:Ubiquitin carboxyl-terminal hydrolase 27 n=1 Tax=Olea europaea subsp. europaea TaxID=158383 RepID=A0A8S0RMH8_OLEEU|nr:ubiquitin carboxyl-terminal hydrolase 27 [Olea europaea subsp. europaea]
MLQQYGLTIVIQMLSIPLYSIPSSCHCWHSAAIKYVSTVAEDKTDIGKLQSCTHDDSCDCKTLSSLQGFPRFYAFICNVLQLMYLDNQSNFGRVIQHLQNHEYIV